MGPLATPFLGFGLRNISGPGPSPVGGLPWPRGAQVVGVGSGLPAGHWQVFSNALMPPVLGNRQRTLVLEPGSQGFGGADCWCVQLSAVTSSVSWSVQWVLGAPPHGMLGDSFKVNTGSWLTVGFRGPVALLDGGSRVGPWSGQIPSCRPVWGGERRRVAPLAEPAQAQLPVLLLMFSFCLSDASRLNYLPREFGLLHLWFWQGLHTNVLPWWSLSHLR